MSLGANLSEGCSYLRRERPGVKGDGERSGFATPVLMPTAPDSTRLVRGEFPDSREIQESALGRGGWGAWEDGGC